MCTKEEEEEMVVVLCCTLFLSFFFFQNQMDYDETIHRTANAVETVDAVEYSPMRTRRLESWLFG